MGMTERSGTIVGRRCSRRMRARALMLLPVLLAVALASADTARADWDDRPDPGEFEESLAPNGYWADDPGFGRVWRPYESWDWRPYVDGQWVWTSYGWTWVSPEPWAWTFHYGRWGFSNLHGWVWVPGYVWGPAWVDWYWGDGYVGWVPLGPSGFAVVPSYWVYVHDYHFCAPRLTNVIVAPRVLPDFIVHHRDHGWGRARPPDLRDVELVSRHRIVRESERPRESIAPWVQHRIERGQPVREHVVERGSERVIEHAARRPAPAVADDGAWHHGKGQADAGGARDHDRGAPGLPSRPTRMGATENPPMVFGPGGQPAGDDRDDGTGGRPAIQPGWTGPSHRAPGPATPDGAHGVGRGGPASGTLGGAEPPRGGGTVQHGGGTMQHGGGGMQHGGGVTIAPGWRGGTGGGGGGGTHAQGGHGSGGGGDGQSSGAAGAGAAGGGATAGSPSR